MSTALASSTKTKAPVSPRNAAGGTTAAGNNNTGATNNNNGGSSSSPPNPTQYRGPKEEFRKIQEYHAFEEPPPPPPHPEFVAAVYNSEKWENRLEAIAKRYSDLLQFERTELDKIAKLEKKLRDLAEEVRQLAFPPPPVPEIVISVGRSPGAGAGGGAKRNAVKKPDTPPPEPLTAEEEKRRTKLFHSLLSAFSKKKLPTAAAAAMAANRAAAQSSSFSGLVPASGGATEGANNNNEGGDIPGKPADVDDETWRKVLSLREERLLTEANLASTKELLQAARDRANLLQVMVDLSAHAASAATVNRERFAPPAGSFAGIAALQSSASQSAVTSGRAPTQEPLSSRKKSFGAKVLG